MLFIQNCLARKSLKCCTPLKKLTGQTPDISMIKNCGFHFYDPVYVKRVASGHSSTAKFPGKLDKVHVFFVGFSEDVGHSITFKVLTEDTKKILYRLQLKSAEKDPNKRLDPPEVPPEVVTQNVPAGIDREG